ncbi:hypothetical protein [Kitasatospora sp. NPDC004289]
MVGPGTAKTPHGAESVAGLRIADAQALQRWEQEHVINREQRVLRATEREAAALAGTVIAALTGDID